MTDPATRPTVDLERFRRLIDDAREAWVAMRDLEAEWHELRDERDRAAIAARGPREAAIAAVCRAAQSFHGYSRLATESDTARLFEALERLANTIPPDDRGRLRVARESIDGARPVLEEVDRLHEEERRLYDRLVEARTRVGRTIGLRDRVHAYLVGEGGADAAKVQELIDAPSRRRSRAQERASTTIRVRG
jgi:hypothetical protein